MDEEDIEKEPVVDVEKNEINDKLTDLKNKKIMV